MAAVLACGNGAVLSHRSAGALWDLCSDLGPRTDVIASGRRGRKIERIRAHHCSISRSEVTEARGIPCTTLTRTLIDLAGMLRTPALRRAVRQAELMGALDFAALMAGTATRRPGSRRLQEVLAALGPEPVLIRSELEERFLALCRRGGLPEPRVNMTVAVGDRRFEVDFAWPESRLIVELDGRAHHGTASAFEADRRRDQLLAIGGWRVIRATWRQIAEEPESLLATVRTLLSA